MRLSPTSASAWKFSSYTAITAIQVDIRISGLKAEIDDLIGKSLTLQSTFNQAPQS